MGSRLMYIENMCIYIYRGSRGMGGVSRQVRMRPFCIKISQLKNLFLRFILSDTCCSKDHMTD